MLHERDEPSAETAGGGSTAAPPLPDLTGVDLHTLFHMDDEALSAAVGHSLRFTDRFAECWCCGENPGRPNLAHMHPGTA